MKNGKISAAAANLFPGYFALVMATGIISIATHLLNMTPIAWTLLIVNLIAYSVLALLLARREQKPSSFGLAGSAGFGSLNAEDSTGR